MTPAFNAYAKYFAAGITPVLLAVQANGLPTDARGWAGLAQFFIAGVVSYRLSPPGSKPAVQP